MVGPALNDVQRIWMAIIGKILFPGSGSRIPRADSASVAPRGCSTKKSKRFRKTKLVKGGKV
jgi:hypothetical protein